MTPTAILIEEQDTKAARFCAKAGNLQSVGHTAGEALDALIAQEAGVINSSMILIQRFVPDAYFTQSQYDRMQQLLN